MSKYESVSNRILLVDHPEDEECSDFTLMGGSCWITVGAFSVYVIDDGDGVRVEIMTKGREGYETLEAVGVKDSDIPEEEEDDE